ncbi:hypothetical protein ABUE34_01830 [Kozakia baliensis]|uniref:hypothetical protein n=1 Tax=Kozakia baliensis TaxID=153496 RepID=UPI00345B5A20
MKRSLSLAVLLLAGCGSATGPDVKSDTVYGNAMDAGRSAFDLAHADQAQTQYEAAYKRALLRDDAPDLADAGYNLAVTLLARNEGQKALDTINRTRSDLALRGHRGTEALSVVQSAALYRLGRYDEALNAARTVSLQDVNLAERAAYLAGISGDALGRADVLAAALSHIPMEKGASSTLWRADRAELSARLALRQGQAQTARQEALQAADLRRNLLDYRDMAQALDIAAIAASRAGDVAGAQALTQRAAQSRTQDQAEHS